jgi:predicted AAA+ superfamily ATPase
MPFHQNIGKRYTKTPKLYFYDSGLLCSLLVIQSEKDLIAHSHRGNIFENAVIAEFFKQGHNTGRRPSLSYWRSADDRKTEVDLIVEKASKLEIFEIKASQTARSKHADALRYFSSQFPFELGSRTVVYEGPEPMRLNDAEFINWQSLASFG